MDKAGTDTMTVPGDKAMLETALLLAVGCTSRCTFGRLDDSAGIS